MSSPYGRQLALAGLQIGAIKLNPEKPFPWASGYYMPIYNDNRLFLSHPQLRRVIVTGFEEFLANRIIPEIIAGTATAGIPHAALLADRLSLPLIYIRDKPKNHGLRNQIEGIDAEKDLEGKRVVVIEDLISTGGSSAAAVEAVRTARGNATHCFSIFNYGLEAAVQAFSALKPPCEVRSLLEYDTLLRVAKESGYLSHDQIGILEEWRADPFGWGEKHGFQNVEKK